VGAPQLLVARRLLKLTMRRGGAILAGFLVALALPAAATASKWTVTELPAGPFLAALYGVDCPSASLCVVVGGNETIATSSDPAGGAAAWRFGRPRGGVETPPGGSIGGEAFYTGGQIRDVSCPSPSLCVAVSFEGQFFTSTDPSGPPADWKVVEQSEDGPNIHMFGVSCPSVSRCIAVAYGGKVLSSSNPTGSSEDWNVTQLAEPYDLRGVSCPSVDFCVAVGNEGEVLVSADPTGGPAAWRSLGSPAGDGTLNAIACPSLSMCVTASAGKILTSTAPGAAGSWNVLSAGTGLPITGMSCPTLSACAAVDNNADAMISTDPIGGAGTWSFENVIPFGSANGMFGLSCPTVSLCVAVGQRYQLMTSENPFAKPALRPEPAAAKGKRPQVSITHHPAKRLDLKKGGVGVRFRFRGIGEVVRFQCKLEGRSYRTCKSPKRYRVGRGKHFFRVRAIGPGGVKGPPATFHFRVGRLIERSPVGSCRVAPPDPIPEPCVNA
jgi:hypothetical protein